MVVAFISARAKVDRARMHFDGLEHEITEFLDGETYKIVEEDDPEAGVRRATIRDVGPIPPHWPLVIGDVLHNLRSALDHAITDLTIAYSGSRLDKTEFPVFTNEEKFDRTKKTGEPAPGSGIFKIRGVDPRVHDVIRDMQPFKFTHQARVTTLQLVHDLNLEDKHRALHVLRYQSTGVGSRWLRATHPIENTLIIGELENGVVLARWIPADPAPGEPDMEFSLAPSIAFAADTPHVAHRGVDEVCEAVIGGVSRVLDYLDGTIATP